MFNVILMKYKNFLLYVQRQTNALLRSYYNFVRVYINNIIIFSHILENYINHLDQIFNLFRKKRMCLFFKKFFLNYSFIMLLD